MAYKINPALHRFPAEAAVIGRIVVAFGELEYMVALCAGQAIGNRDLILKMLYSLNSTGSRIQAADTLMQPAYESVSLKTEQTLTMDAVRFCASIRNQYAHCNFGDHQPTPEAGLFFTDLEDSAEQNDGFHHYWKHVDVALLEQQEAYFVYAQGWLFFLEYELAFRRGRSDAVRFPVPVIEPPPMRHNPPRQHVPPWLSEDQRLRHTMRAAAAEQCARPKQRPPSVLRLTEEEWEAKKAKDARLAAKSAE